MPAVVALVVVVVVVVVGLVDVAASVVVVVAGAVVAVLARAQGSFDDAIPLLAGVLKEGQIIYYDGLCYREYSTYVI